MLDFRHEAASAVTAGHLHVPYTVIDPCTVYEFDMCICKTSKVITTSGNLADMLDF